MLTFAELANKYQLDLILMFGSRVGGNVHAGSDIDIAVYARHPFSETEKIQLICELSNIFRTDNVDMVDLRNCLPPFEKGGFSKLQGRSSEGCDVVVPVGVG